MFNSPIWILQVLSCNWDSFRPFNLFPSLVVTFTPLLLLDPSPRLLQEQYIKKSKLKHTTFLLKILFTFIYAANIRWGPGPVCQINAQCWDCGISKTNRVSMPKELCLPWLKWSSTMRPLSSELYFVPSLSQTLRQQHTSVSHPLYASLCFSPLWFSLTDPLLSSTFICLFLPTF